MGRSCKVLAMTHIDIFERFRLHSIWIDSLGKDGARLEVEDYNFERVDFSNINLNESIIAACSFKLCTLNKVNFNGANLSSSSFSGEALVGCNFNKAIIDYCNFENSYIDKCYFFRASMFETNFKNITIINGDVDKKLWLASNI